VANLLIIIVSFALGVLLRRTGRFGEHAPSALNAFVLNISLPAAALIHVHALRFDSSLLFAVVAPWILFIVGALLLDRIGRALALPERTIGCMVLLGGLGNTSFVGLPMIEAMYGRDALGIGILADQPGSFLVLATLGLIAAARYSGGAATPREIALRIGRFVPFWAMVAGLLLTPFEYPPIAATLLARLADTLTPLAMVSVGMQLRVGHLAGRTRPLALGLGWKMLLGPLMILAIGLAVGIADPLTLHVTVFEMAMPPMVTAGIIALEHDLDPPLAALFLGIGIPISLATLPLWARLMG
jgi:malate permease and related proteins